MHLLYKRIYNLDLPLDLQLKLFDHTILPILTYACEVWGFENLSIVERIHSNFLRKITKTRKSTPLYILYGELGRYPIEIIIKTRMINFWNKLVTHNGFKISHICYKFMQNSTYRCKWLAHIKNILNNTGYTDIWINQNNLTSNHVSKLVKQTLIDQYTQSWHGQLNLSSKGFNYKLFKDSITFEPYLTLLPKQQYIPILKFRTANNFFVIETSRWLNRRIPLENRKCDKCNNMI